MYDNKNDFQRVMGKKDIVDEVPVLSQVTIPKMSPKRREFLNQRERYGALTSSEIAMRDSHKF